MSAFDKIVVHDKEIRDQVEAAQRKMYAGETSDYFTGLIDVDTDTLELSPAFMVKYGLSRSDRTGTDIDKAVRRYLKHLELLSRGDYRPDRWIRGLEQDPLEKRLRE